LGIIKTDIVESYFSTQQTASGKLSILVGMDSFCYCIYDASGQPLFLRRLGFPVADTFALDLEEISAQNPLLFFPYAEIALAIGSSRHALVPARLFDAGSARACLAHGNDIGSADRVCSAFLPSQEAHLVYAVPEALDTWRSKNFPRVEPLHFSQAVLQQIPAHWQSGKRLLAHFWDSRILLFYFESGRLVFENWFICRDAKDFLYYLLLVFDRFHLSTETQELVLSGTILPDSEVFRLLSRYIRQLNFAVLGAPRTYGSKMSTHAPHFFNDLNAVVQFRKIS
jgi:hypothetical protein